MTKSLFYISNANTDIFPSNTNCDFKTRIPQNFFQDINPTDVILVGVHRISFTLKEHHSINLVGIKSNLVIKHQIVNNTQIQLLCTFSLPSLNNSVFNKKNPKQQTFEIVNQYPVYCESSIENLTRASFELFDISTNNSINHLFDPTVPTVIEIYYKIMPMNKKSYFNCFFQSDDQNSKQIFQSNNNVDFSIVQPERIHLEKGWRVILRDFSITKNFANVEEEYYRLWMTEFNIKIHMDEDQNKTYMMDQINPNFIASNFYYIPSGFYQNRNTLLEEVNKVLKEKLKIEFELFSSEIFHGNIVNLRKVGATQTKSTYRRRTLHVSYRLAVALGFCQPSNLKSEQQIDTNNDFSIDLNLYQNQEFEGRYPVNIHYFYPRQIVIHCDILSNSIVGNKQFQVLHIINTNPSNEEEKMIKLNINSKTTQDLEIFSFQKIRFWFTDIEGQTLNPLSQEASSISLTFVNLT